MIDEGYVDHMHLELKTLKVSHFPMFCINLININLEDANIDERLVSQLFDVIKANKII